MSDAYGAADPGGGGAPQPGGAGDTPQAGGPPQAGGGLLAALQRQQPGPGPSVPGQGNQADAMTSVQTAMDLLEKALQGVPAGSAVYKDLVNALRQLSRHLPQGSVPAGAQQTQLGDLLRMVMRSGMLQHIMSQQGGGQAGQQAPQPSTPLPGA